MTLLSKFRVVCVFKIVHLCINTVETKHLELKKAGFTDVRWDIVKKIPISISRVCFVCFCLSELGTENEQFMFSYLQSNL